MPQWREAPVQWIEGRWLKIARTGSQGLIASLAWTITLEPQGRGCLVRHDLAIAPRGIFGAFILSLFGLPYLDQRMKEVGQTMALWANGSIDHPMPRPRTLPKQTHRSLSDRAMLADGSQYGRGQVSRLVRWMTQAQHQDTAHIRPSSHADLWGMNQDEVTEIMLAGTAAEILTKKWRLTCSSCGSQISDCDYLSDLPDSTRCDVCSAKVEVEFGRNVTMFFTPAAGLRGFHARRYAWESPNDHPGVGVRIKVEAKGRLTSNGRAGRSGFLAKVVGTGSSTTIMADAGAPRLLLRDGIVSATASDQSSGTIEIVNNDNVERHVALGPIEGAERRSNARRILLLQAHRDIGGEELPRVGAAFALNDVAILTSDLSGLVTRYQKSGDATTFKAVSELLQGTTDIVRECGGSVSSRLGEIVVAVFPEPKQAVAAAFRLSSHNDDEGLPAFRGSIDVGDLSATAHRGRLIFQGTSIKRATAMLRMLDEGEVALGGQLVGLPSVIKLIQEHPLEPIGDENVGGGKIKIGGRSNGPDENSDQSASAA
jgi:hypothetical protein